MQWSACWSSRSQNLTITESNNHTSVFVGFVGWFCFLKSGYHYVTQASFKFGSFCFGKTSRYGILWTQADSSVPDP